MDKDTIVLIVIFSAIVLLGAIFALLIAYDLNLKYKASLNEIENDEEDINTIIARVIDQEFDKRFEELGLIPRPDDIPSVRNSWYRYTNYPADSKTMDKFQKLVKDMSEDSNDNS